MNREGYYGEVMTLRWKTEKLCTQNKTLYMIYIAKKVTGFDNFIYTACLLTLFLPLPLPLPFKVGGDLEPILNSLKKGPNICI